jgi:beta-glucosidase
MLAANAAIIAVMALANVVLLAPTFAQKITSWICPPVIDSEAVEQSRATGQELSKNIVLEGSVLVKNNGVLPLDPISDSSVNVFGHASIDWVYGGSGSGQVVPENNNSSENIDFLEALDSYYIDYNDDLINMYKNFAPAVGDIGSIGTLYDSFYKLYEPSITNTNFYTGKLLDDAKAFSNTAFCVIGRHAGETEDPTRVQYKGKSMGISVRKNNKPP